MATRSVWNPTTDLNGLEAVPSRRSWMTLKPGEGFMYQFTPKQTCTDIGLLPVSSNLSNTRVGIEVLTSIKPAAATTLTHFNPTADSVSTSVTGGFANIDDWTAEDANQVVFDDTAITSRAVLVVRSSSMSVSGRVLYVQTESDYNSIAGSVASSYFLVYGVLRMSGINYTIGEWYALPRWPQNAYVEYKVYNNPQTKNPWTASQVNSLDDSASFGWGWEQEKLLISNSAHLGLQRSRLTVATKADNRVDFDYDASAGITSWPVAGGGLLNAGLTGTFTAGTTYYLHIFPITGSLTIPYVLFDLASPSTVTSRIRKTSYDQSMYTIAQSSDLGVGAYGMALTRDLTSVTTAHTATKATFTKSSHGLENGQMFWIASASEPGYQDFCEVENSAGSTWDSELGTTPSTDPSLTVTAYDPTVMSLAFDTAESDFVKVDVDNKAEGNLTCKAGDYVQVKFVAGWGSANRPTAPLVVQVRTATAGGGSLLGSAIVSTNESGISRNTRKLVTLSLDTSFTASLQDERFIYFQSQTSTNSPWGIPVMDTATGGGNGIVYANGSPEHEKLSWTGQRTNHLQDRLTIGVTSDGTSIAGTDHDMALQFVVAQTFRSRLEGTVLGLTPTAFWPMQETSGTTIADIGGSGHTATLSGATYTLATLGPFWDSAGKDYAVFIDDDNNAALSAADHTNFDTGTGNFSVSVWVNVAGNAAVKHIFRHVDTAATGWRLYLDASEAFQFDIYSGGTPTTYSLDETIVTDTWVHVAVTVTRTGNAVIYIGGVSAGSVSIAAQSAVNLTNAETFRLGHGAADTQLNGRMAYAAFWKGTALSADQVKQIYDAGVQGFAHPVAEVTVVKA